MPPTGNEPSRSCSAARAASAAVTSGRPASCAGRTRVSGGRPGTPGTPPRPPSPGPAPPPAPGAPAHPRVGQQRVGNLPGRANQRGGVTARPGQPGHPVPEPVVVHLPLGRLLLQPLRADRGGFAETEHAAGGPGGVRNLDALNRWSLDQCSLFPCAASLSATRAHHVRLAGGPDLLGTLPRRFLRLPPALAY